MVTTFQPTPDRPPPPSTVGVIGWLRANLFNSWFNSLLTLLAVVFLASTVPGIFSWAFLDAVWFGDAEACRAQEGACWAFILAKPKLFLVGSYPAIELWRPSAAAIMLTVLAGVTAFHMLPARVLVVLWLLLPVPAFWLVGGGLGLANVDTSLWGGLMLSLLLAVVGILVSIPLGVILALGRRSDIAIFRGLCTGLIEVVRGVPLITILFMATIMLPLFLPSDMEFSIFYRVQIGIVLFSSAYMAEVVRGGLQAVPRGQYEAAHTLGLKHWQTTYLIILPQALKNVLSPLIGRCIALLKDTALVIVVGLLDFLGVAKAAAQDPEWLGFDIEAYAYCALVYWLMCFSMSRYGNFLERQGQGAVVR